MFHPCASRRDTLWPNKLLVFLRKTSWTVTICVKFSHRFFPRLWILSLFPCHRTHACGRTRRYFGQYYLPCVRRQIFSKQPNHICPAFFGQQSLTSAFGTARRYASAGCKQAQTDCGGFGRKPATARDQSSELYPLLARL